MPAGVTAVAWSQANGRAEQRTINVEDARRCGVEVILDHPAAQWAVRHAEWIQNFIVKSDVGLSGSGTIKITLREAHTGDKKHRAMLLDSWTEFLFAVALAHTAADIITLMEDGSVRYNGS